MTLTQMCLNCNARYDSCQIYEPLQHRYHGCISCYLLGFGCNIWQPPKPNSSITYFGDPIVSNLYNLCAFHSRDPCTISKLPQFNIPLTCVQRTCCEIFLKWISDIWCAVCFSGVESIVSCLGDLSHGDDFRQRGLLRAIVHWAPCHANLDALYMRLWNSILLRAPFHAVSKHCCVPYTVFKRHKMRYWTGETKRWSEY